MIKLLDCTLRDGGYLNDWEFGKNSITNIFERLVSAELDIIEVGFIDDRRSYDVNRTIFPDTISINQSFGKLNKGNSIIVGMIDYGTCSIEHIMPCSECYLDGIRVIFKKHVMHNALDFCRQIKDLGYRIFVQAVSITSYDDDELSELIELVNELEPYAFSLVDTYGLLHKGQLMHYFNFAAVHLSETIGLGYHAHNNFQLAYANCIELIQNPPQKRLLLVDGTLYGMGKSAGNTPIELLTTYLNEYHGHRYQVSQLLEAIEVTILDIRKRLSWGYSFHFFVAASNDCHPNYVSYLMDLKKLSVKSINEILQQIEPDKKLFFDETYIKGLYLDYQSREFDDSVALKQLENQFMGQSILLIGPGERLQIEIDRVNEYMVKEHPVTLAVNYIPQNIAIDYVFMSNAKRYVGMSASLSEYTDKIITIATSNVTKSTGKFDYILNYGSLLDETAFIPDNPMMMLLHMFDHMGVKKVALAGFDGYLEAPISDFGNPNKNIVSSKEIAQRINQDVRDGLKKIEHKDRIIFITETLYERNEV